MATQKLLFKCGTHSPDYNALKAQLGSLPGISQMDIDSRTGDVSVLFDRKEILPEQIEQRVDSLGYHLDE